MNIGMQIKYSDGFIAELVVDHDTKYCEWWIYHKEYGVKMLCYGYADEPENYHDQLTTPNHYKRVYRKLYMN